MRQVQRQNTGLGVGGSREFSLITTPFSAPFLTPRHCLFVLLFGRFFDFQFLKFEIIIGSQEIVRSCPAPQATHSVLRPDCSTASRPGRCCVHGSRYGHRATDLVQPPTSFHMPSCAGVVCKCIPWVWICVLTTTVKIQNDSCSRLPCLQLCPCPLETLICSPLSLLECYVSGIMHYVTFGYWFFH